MANIKSAKKRAKQNIERRKRNLTRRTAMKTAVKKVIASLEKGEDVDKTQKLLKEANAKISRATSKGIIHKNTAARMVSNLAKKVAVVAKKEKPKTAKKAS